jgi:hypothetical protein
MHPTTFGVEPHYKIWSTTMQQLQNKSVDEYTDS